MSGLAPAVEVRRITRVSRRFVRSDVVVIVAGVILALIVLGAIFAPLLAPYNPNTINLLAPDQGPSVSHWFGTDDTGRDILSRVLFGARPALLGPAAVVVGATVVGTAVAIFTAWVGGRVDAAISRTLDVLFAFPGLLLAILAVAVFGVGFGAPVIALGVAYTPYIARVVRSAAVRERSLPYIAACSAQGFSPWSICARHLLPNVLPVVVVQATLSFGYALIDLTSLSFLGFGLQPPSSDWGLMVAEGQSALLANHVEQALFAGGAIVLTVLCCVVVGERLARTSETSAR